jgi:hypothetical protein
MEVSPLSDQRESASRQKARDYLASEVDRCHVTRVPRMEMRARMRALVPVHPDRDPVDPRHPVNGTGIGRRRII